MSIDALAIKWCGMCNNVPADGVAKLEEHDGKVVDLPLCNGCFEKLQKKMG